MSKDWDDQFDLDYDEYQMEFWCLECGNPLDAVDYQEGQVICESCRRIKELETSLGEEPGEYEIVFIPDDEDDIN